MLKSFEDGINFPFCWAWAQSTGKISEICLCFKAKSPTFETVEYLSLVYNMFASLLCPWRVSFLSRPAPWVLNLWEISLDLLPFSQPLEGCGSIVHGDAEPWKKFLFCFGYWKLNCKCVCVRAHTHTCGSALWPLQLSLDDTFLSVSFL